MTDLTKTILIFTGISLLYLIGLRIIDWINGQ